MFESQRTNGVRTHDGPNGREGAILLTLGDASRGSHAPDSAETNGHRCTLCSTGGVSDEAQAVDVVPTESPIPDGLRVAKSLLLVNTGDGKGKSTAAFGTMLRALAQGWPVAVVQFLKSGDWKVGEEKIGRELGVDWWALGDGFTWDSENLDESTAIAQEAWRAAMEHINSNRYRLVILDEVTYPMNWGWIDSGEVVSTLVHRPEKVSVICTGRNASSELIAAADTVTEMQKVTHAYDQGIRAKKGIDY